MVRKKESTMQALERVDLRNINTSAKQQLTWQQQLAKTNPNYRRRALITGCQTYWNPNWNLQGPENDAKNVYDTLRINMMPRTGIKTILNEKATYAGILDGIRWLLSGAEKGDICFWYHSGHGTELMDLNKDEWPHPYDQALVPWDGDWEKGTMITDDVIFKEFTENAPKDILSETFFDTCYSGTATRSADFGFKAYHQRRQRYLPPPFDMKREILATPPFYLYSKIHTPGAKLVYNSEQANVHWSSSTHLQVSYEDEIEGVIQGVGTYAWCKIMNKQEGGMPRGFVYEKVNDMIFNHLQYPQTFTLDVGSDDTMMQRYPLRRVTEDEPGEI